MNSSLDVMPPGVTEAKAPTDSGGVSQEISADVLSGDSIHRLGAGFYTEWIPAQKTQDLLESYALSQIHIGSLLDLRLRMSESVALTMERDDIYYVAWCEELDEYGYGFDPISAVNDARHAIAELYWQLKADRERLGPDLARVWQRLSELVYEI